MLISTLFFKIGSITFDFVFTLDTNGEELKLQGGVKLKDGVLLIPSGNATLLTPPDIMDGSFSFIMELIFDEPGEMPVVLGFGQYMKDGWFLQKISGRWRFHLSRKSCDGGTVPIGEWVRLVGIYDGEKAQLYQNKKKIAEVDLPTAPTAWDKPVYIGQYTSKNEKSYQFKGKIRKLEIYQRVIDANEL